jgi:hypothetical protein
MKGRVLILCLAAALVVPLGGAASAAETPAPECTWGASSAVAELNGRELVVSEAATSGCIP